jgi:hypothetical protein
MFKHAKGFRGNKPGAAKPIKLKVGGGGSAGKKRGLVQRAIEKWKADESERAEGSRIHRRKR